MAALDQVYGGLYTQTTAARLLPPPPTTPQHDSNTSARSTPAKRPAVNKKLRIEEEALGIHKLGEWYDLTQRSAAKKQQRSGSSASSVASREQQQQQQYARRDDDAAHTAYDQPMATDEPSALPGLDFGAYNYKPPPAAFNLMPQQQGESQHDIYDEIDVSSQVESKLRSDLQTSTDTKPAVAALPGLSTSLHSQHSTQSSQSPQFRRRRPEGKTFRDVTKKQDYKLDRVDEDGNPIDRRGPKRGVYNDRTKTYTDNQGQKHSGANARLYEKEDVKSRRQRDGYLADNLVVDGQFRHDNSYEPNDLRYWRIPPAVASVYAAQGIKELWPWQVECLHQATANVQRNFLFSASTSAGKTLIVEVLMFHQLQRNRKCLVALPFKALTHEQFDRFITRSRPLATYVTEFVGFNRQSKHQQYQQYEMTQDVNVGYATIEKANDLINRLTEQGRLQELGCIVVDELHLLSDISRGSVLELLISKILHHNAKMRATDQVQHCIQIIACSATLPNIVDLQRWLDCAYYETDFRPVPLQRYAVVGNQAVDSDGQAVQLMHPSVRLPIANLDYATSLLLALVERTLSAGKSVLIFCETRRQCEETSLLLAKQLKDRNTSPADDVLQQSRNVLLHALTTSLLPDPVDAVLAVTIPSGVGYHHAGMLTEERETVELAFKDNSINVLCATSTLSAGVNLPAHTVLFRTPYGADWSLPRKLLSSTTYHQASGRAGRYPLDHSGESILLCNEPARFDDILRLMNDPLLPLRSSLLDVTNSDRHGLARGILDMLRTDQLKSVEQVYDFVQHSLFAQQYNGDLLQRTREAIHQLQTKQLLTLQDVKQEHQLKATAEYEKSKESADAEVTTNKLVITAMGKATSLSTLSPVDAALIMHDLNLVRRTGLCLSSNLHICWLIVPAMASNTLSLNEQQIVALTESLAHRADHVESYKVIERNYTSERDRVRREQNKHLPFDKKRLVSAYLMLLYIEEEAKQQLADRYGVPRGQMEKFANNIAVRAHQIANFCAGMNWITLSTFITRVADQLTVGTPEELVELMSITEMKRRTARTLYNNGVTTIKDVANGQEVVEELLLKSEEYVTASTKAQREWFDPGSDMEVKRNKDLLEEAQSLVQTAKRMLLRGNKATTQSQ